MTTTIEASKGKNECHELVDYCHFSVVHFYQRPQHPYVPRPLAEDQKEFALMTDTLRTKIANALADEIDTQKSSDDAWEKHLARNGDFNLQKLTDAVIKNLNEYRREELLQFAIWLLKDENSEGREDQIVGKYLEKWRGSANCCEGGPQWGHAWTCPMAD